MDNSVTTVLRGLESIRSDVEEFYKDLHAHPELGLQEHRTAGKAAAALRDLGYEVTEGIGGTGVVGVLTRDGRKGQDGTENRDGREEGRAGPTVLLRADMDALPVRERTGLPYASTATTTDREGHEQPVMHACGHDIHVACMTGFARLMAQAPEGAWHGTLVVLLQPSEEDGAGARAMIDDGLTDRVPRPDVVLAQHVLPYPAGQVGTRAGAFLSAADSLRITLHGRGGHGSAPQSTVDPVVLAAMCVVRLQTVVSREVGATSPAVVTVGRIRAGSGPNVIPDQAELELNVRTYDPAVRRRVLDAVERIVRAECQASDAPQEPEFEQLTRFPPTVNDDEVTATVARAFADCFGDDARTFGLQTASEDLSEIPAAFGVPFTYWGFGGTDPDRYATAEQNGTLDRDIPTNHSPTFAPLPQPTLDTGIKALTAATLAWLGDGG